MCRGCRGDWYPPSVATVTTHALPGAPHRLAAPTLLALTELVGEGQHEGGLLQGPFQQGSVVGASPWMLPVRLWGRQMAELPRGVGWTPALVPANAASSIQAGDLAEICNDTLDD